MDLFCEGFFAAFAGAIFCVVFTRFPPCLPSRFERAISRQNGRHGLGPIIGLDTHQPWNSSRSLEVPGSCWVPGGRFSHLSATIFEPPLCKLFKAGTLPDSHEPVDLSEEASLCNLMAYDKAGGAVRSGSVSCNAPCVDPCQHRRSQERVDDVQIALVTDSRKASRESNV